MKILLATLLCTILLSSTVMAQVDFTQDEIFDEIDTSEKLLVISEGVVLCKDKKIMGSIAAFIEAEEFQQAQELYMTRLCFFTPHMITVWKIGEDLSNDLVQFRVLPPTIIKVGRNMDNWWIEEKFIVSYSEYLKLMHDELLKLQKGLNIIENQVETRES